MNPGDVYFTPLTPDTDWLSAGDARDWGRLRADAAELAMQLVSAGSSEDAVVGCLDPATVSSQAPFGWLLWEHENERTWVSYTGGEADELQRCQLRLAPDGVIYQVIVKERKELGLTGTISFGGESSPATDRELERSETVRWEWELSDAGTAKKWEILSSGPYAPGGLAGALRALRVRLLEPLGNGTPDAKWF